MLLEKKDEQNHLLLWLLLLLLLLSCMQIRAIIFKIIYLFYFGCTGVLVENFAALVALGQMEF